MIEATPRLAAVFPVNMGNRGHNMLSVPDAFQRLAAVSNAIEFVGYHRRLSGNFIVRYHSASELQNAAGVAAAVLGLRCLARSFSDLAQTDGLVPPDAELVRGSVILRTPNGARRVVFVALSNDIPQAHQVLGVLNRRVQVIAWPSARDVLCLYDRPGEQGDVGQVTRAVVGAVGRSKASVYGTGRAVSVVRDLLDGRYVEPARRSLE